MPDAWSLMPFIREVLFLRLTPFGFPGNSVFFVRFAVTACGSPVAVSPYTAWALYRKVTIWARVQLRFGPKASALTPAVIPRSTAQAMALRA